MAKKMKERNNFDIVERKKPMYAATVEEALSDTGRYLKPVTKNHRDFSVGRVQGECDLNGITFVIGRGYHLPSGRPHTNTVN